MQLYRSGAEREFSRRQSDGQERTLSGIMWQRVHFPALSLHHVLRCSAHHYAQLHGHSQVKGLAPSRVTTNYSFVDSHGFHARNRSLSSSHLSLNREGRCGTTDDFTTSFFHFFSVLPLSSGIWRTPGLSIPRCCLPVSSSLSLVLSLSLCLARWF